ncbi:hypothetical protein F4604DRAFT_1517513, partial [Suillus subluteus]
LNASTGFSPFQLHLGRSPRMLPTLIPTSTSVEEPEHQRAERMLSQLKHDVMEAQDNLLAAKAAQAASVNNHRAPLSRGVLLATKYRRREYMQKGDKRVAK